MKKSKVSKKKLAIKSTSSGSKKSSSKNKSGGKKKSGSKKGVSVDTFGQKVKKGLANLTEQVESIFSSQPQNIQSAIKMDHDGLRNFLGLLKDTDSDMTERRRAYDQFRSLLKSHTHAEESVVYKTAVDLPGKEMHLKVTEGFVEHKLTEDLMRRIENTTVSMEWSAHANVLSEILEHHLKEEERDLLPLLKKATPPKLNQEMLEQYLELREKTQYKVTKENSGVLDPSV